MKTIELQLKVKHFEGTDFFSPCSCTIGKAYTELTGINKVETGIDNFSDYHNKKRFSHSQYCYFDFSADAELAASRNFDESIIRTIILKEV